MSQYQRAAESCIPSAQMIFFSIVFIHLVIKFVCALEVPLEEGPAQETLSDDAKAQAICESMDVCPKQSCYEN